MADLILAAVLLLGSTSAAEGLRRSFRRRLATPMVPVRRAAPAADTGLQLRH
jgi:hypothetical protein